MSESTFQRIEQLLKRHGVAFDVLRHEPVYTSQQAARVRGTPLASGAKALVCKGDDRLVLFVLPADLKLASKAVRRGRGWRKLRFASRDEVFERTGLEPGIFGTTTAWSGMIRHSTMRSSTPRRPVWTWPFI